MNLEGKVKTLQDLSAQMNQREETLSQLQLQFNALEKEKVTSISYCFIVNKCSYVYLLSNIRGPKGLYRKVDRYRVENYIKNLCIFCSLAISRRESLPTPKPFGKGKFQTKREDFRPRTS